MAGLRTLLKPGEAVALWAVSVDSAADSRNFSATIAKDGKGSLSFPLLSDAGHRVIDAYGLQDPRYLKQSSEGIPYPTTYVIDKAGRLVYRGAIDNSPDGEKQSPAGGKLVSYVDDALEDLEAGRPVRVAETKPYGCSVKYAR